MPYKRTPVAVARESRSTTRPFVLTRRALQHTFYFHSTTAFTPTIRSVIYMYMNVYANEKPTLHKKYTNEEVYTRV